MKLSDILLELHDSGDVGKAVQGLAELAEALEKQIDESQKTINNYKKTVESHYKGMLRLAAFCKTKKVPLLPVDVKELDKFINEERIEAVHDFVTFLPTYAYDINMRLRNEANKFEAKLRQGDSND